MPEKKKVIIIDDHDLFREGLKVLLSNTNTIEVVADARNGQEFLKVVKKYNPDVVLMDISMPVMDGIEATKLGIAENPDLKVLVLTMFGDETNYLKMLQAGARGFILKSSVLKELEKAILALSANENYFSNELVSKLMPVLNDQTDNSVANSQEVSSLAKQEIDILKLVVAGFSNEDIAHNLKISVPNVKSHRSNLVSKTSCRNSSSLVMYVIKNKILELN